MPTNKPDSITQLDVGRTKRFLRYLESHPFVAVIFMDNATHVFVSGTELDSVVLRNMNVVLDQLEEQMNADSNPQ